VELFQHVLVTAAALAAATFICRRVFSTLKPMKGAARCGSCAPASRRMPSGGATTPLIQISTADGARARPRAKVLSAD
jgi:hypothetical protein